MFALLNSCLLSRPTTTPLKILLKICLHNSVPFKLMFFSLTLSSSVTKTTSVALRSCHGICIIDSKIPYLLGVFVLAPLFASTWIVWTHRRRKLEHNRMSLFDRNGGNILKKKLSNRKRSRSAQLKIYTAQEMEIATNNYSETDGKFCRGTFENNREAVVMKIPTLVPESKIKQFIGEVIRRSLRRGNETRISGCCLETSFPLLVYELHVDGTHALPGCMRGGGAGVLPRLLQLLPWRRASENGGDSVSGAVDDEESGGAVEERPTLRELEDELSEWILFVN